MEYNVLETKTARLVLTNEYWEAYWVMLVQFSSMLQILDCHLSSERRKSERNT